MLSVRPPSSTSILWIATGTPLLLLFLRATRRGRAARSNASQGVANGSPERSHLSLAAQSEVGDQLQVTIVLGAGQVIEQSAAIADHLEQAAARVVVMLVRAQVLGQRIDTPGQQCDLDVGGASVAIVEPVLFNRGGSVGLG